MDYYELFWMNARGDAHSTRNKGRLSHERMGCFVQALDSRKLFAESYGQEDEFGTDHFQLYENWDKFLTKKSHRKPNRTKSRAYENQGLTVLLLK